jgi:hypothetical protein
MIRWLSLALFLTLGPLGSMTLLGGRDALGMLSGGDPTQVVKAMAFVMAWVWAVVVSVPLAVGAVALGARR